MDIKKAISSMKEVMDISEINASEGLGDDLFHFVSTLVPIINVDLLVFNNRNEILLAWRDDIHCGAGWHVPGGCIRFYETMEERVHKTALTELGCDVVCNKEPIKIIESIHDNMACLNSKERSHFISLLFACEIIDGCALKNLDGRRIAGHLGWFSSLPADFIKIQEYYRNYLEKVLPNP